MVNMNVFRILGDVSHTASKCILIWAIHANQSAEGNHLWPCLVYLADMVAVRCFIDHADALRCCLYHPLPRSFLDSAFRFYMELYPEKLLYPLFTLHYLSHDEGLCSNTRKRKSMEVRCILFWGINAPGAHCHGHCCKTKF